MKYVTIWRVERSDGVGPYQGVGQDSWAETDHDSARRTPRVCCDGLCSERDSNRFVTQHKFGFESPNQLFAWFTKREVARLLSLGYSIVSIKVRESDVVCGKRQVAFVDRRRFKSDRRAA